MEVSFKLENVENHLLGLLIPINDSQEIKRYIKYLSNEPLELNSQQPNIDYSLIGEHIILTPFSNEIITETKVMLFINPIDIDLDNPNTSIEMFQIDIIVPITHWILSGTGKIRPIRIASEISKLIDKQKIAGIGEVKLTKAKTWKINDKYSAFTIWIRVKGSNMKVMK